MINQITQKVIPFNPHIQSYLNGNLSTFKEWYLLLSDCDKDDFIIFVSNHQELTDDDKFRLFRFLLRSLI